MISKFQLLIILLFFAEITNAKNVTHEDLRDGLFSLAHNIRQMESQLERHENRDKQTADSEKKMLINLEKRLKPLDALKGVVSRLDERIAVIETILIQDVEKEKKQKDEIKEVLENLRKQLDKIDGGSNSGQSCENNNQDLEKELKEMKTILKELKTKTISNEDNIQKLNNQTTNIQSIIKNTQTNTEKVLEKYDTKLEEYNNRVIPTEIIPPHSADFNSNFLTALDTQRTLLEQISSDVKSINSDLKKVSGHSRVDDVINTTLQLVQEIKYELKRNNNLTTNSLISKLDKVETKLQENHDEIAKSVSDLSVMTDSIYSGVTKSYEQLHNELQGLNKIEKILIQTADNVLDTKRRIEYGVHQILLEVGDLIRLQSEGLNTTVNQRFDDIESTILDNQTGALANLSSKIEMEMSQVWRQIGIMYQSITASNTVLDRLQTQTETYINGTITTMDSMEGKVGQITGRMMEVDDNLNYLLGRLSLVTQEFNDIKSGLGTALDKIKKSFLMVKNQIEDAGPGPHQIPSNEITSES